MKIDRRLFTFCGLTGAALVVADTASGAPSRSAATYGLITQFITRPEERDAFVGILADSAKGLPGCLSYIIAKDAARDDAVWVTEVWVDAASHAASLKLPAVQKAIAKGRPRVTGMGCTATTHPVAGV